MVDYFWSGATDEPFCWKAYFWLCGVPEYANQSTPRITFWAVYAWSDHERVQTNAARNAGSINRSDWNRNWRL